MPTPESAAFLAKKPTVPPTYEGVDFEDNVAVHNARDAIIREQWVRSMMARLVGEELGKCYAREGVNHLEKCGVLRGEFGSFFPMMRWVDWDSISVDTVEMGDCRVDWLGLGRSFGLCTALRLLTCSTEKYFELLKERKVKGYLGQEKNYFEKSE